MTKHTSRDSVWDCALRLALDGKSFDVQQMRDSISEAMSDRTVRDTLNTMVDRGWLDKESPHSHKWNPGPRISGEEVDDSSPSKESVEPTPVSNMNSPSDLNEGEFYSGEVSEFWHDGALVQLDSGHINLGPIDPAAKGEIVIFESVGWNWGKCMSEEYTDESYNPRDATVLSEDSPPSNSTTSRSTSSASSNGSLDNIAEEAGTTTSSQTSSSSPRPNSGWDDRKKSHLEDIGKKHK